MDRQFAFSTAAILITLIGGFAGLMVKLGSLETKIGIMWDWYIQETRAAHIGGRRHTDMANDHPDEE